MKATNYFNTVDIFKLSVKNFNYSKINKVKEVNGFEIYKSENWQCADYKNICVNTIKKEYKFDKNLDT